MGVCVSNVCDCILRTVACVEDRGETNRASDDCVFDATEERHGG